MIHGSLLWNVVRSGAICLIAAASAWTPLQAQINVGVNPPDNATGVSTSQAVVFSFDWPMDAEQTSAVFIRPPFEILPATAVWSWGNTVLTCTPVAPWPAGADIYWSLEGVGIDGTDEVSFFGSFKTAGAATGHGTNRITSYLLEAVHFFVQTNASPPVLDPDYGYSFLAEVSLASNWIATAVTLDLPTGSYLDLTQDMFFPEDYYVVDSQTSLAGFNAAYPGGTYTFSVYGTPEEVVTVELAAATEHPNPPQLSDYAALQSVDPSQPLTINWGAFSGGRAEDSIFLEIGDVYSSPDTGQPNALTGQARSVTLPANTLAPDTTYEAYLTFYRAGAFSSNSTHTTTSLRAAQTLFTLTTRSGGTPQQPQLASYGADPDGTFRFEIRVAPQQSVDVQVSTSLQPNSWSTVLTTNTASGVIEYHDTAAPTEPRRFYRVRTGG